MACDAALLRLGSRGPKLISSAHTWNWSKSSRGTPKIAAITCTGNRAVRSWTRSALPLGAIWSSSAVTDGAMTSSPQRSREEARKAEATKLR